MSVADKASKSLNSVTEPVKGVASMYSVNVINGIHIEAIKEPIK
jgi:hypothetical protein